MKKALIIAGIVLAAALAGGVWWYTSQPAPVEDPEPQDDAVAVGVGADEPEPEPEPPEETPETGEDHFGEIFYNEETGEFEFVDGSGSVSEVLGLEDKTEEEPADQQGEQDTEPADQQPGDNQQQEQTGGYDAATEEEIARRWEKIQRKLDEAGISHGSSIAEGKGSLAGDGSMIHWN